MGNPVSNRFLNQRQDMEKPNQSRYMNTNAQNNKCMIETYLSFNIPFIKLKTACFPHVKVTRCYFEEGYLNTSVYLWEELPCGQSIQGPAIIIDKNRQVFSSPLRSHTFQTAVRVDFWRHPKSIIRRKHYKLNMLKARSFTSLS